MGQLTDDNLFDFVNKNVSLLYTCLNHILFIKYILSAKLNK